MMDKCRAYHCGKNGVMIDNVAIKPGWLCAEHMKEALYEYCYDFCVIDWVTSEGKNANTELSDILRSYCEKVKSQLKEFYEFESSNFDRETGEL